MKKIVKDIIFWAGLVVGSTAVGVSSYYIVKQIREGKTNSSSISINNWENIPDSFRQFSIENAFKITLPSGDLNGNTYLASEGTAWSWYYEQQENSNIWDWYLMTNFHVVNDCIKYINHIENDDLLLDYYKDKEHIETDIPNDKKDFFKLSKYNNDDQSSKYKENTYINLLVNIYPNIESISIITDFQNDYIKLFSDSDFYNLDIALIKFTISNPPINDKWNKPNIISMYNNLDNETKSILLNDNDAYKYIAGNPGIYNMLVGVLIDNQWNHIMTLPKENNIYQYLTYDSSWFSAEPFKNFILEEGSSGSAVYQISKNNLNDDFDLSKQIPIGIYWGGGRVSENGTFKPSFIPFYYEGQNSFYYNIYDNFINFLSQK